MTKRERTIRELGGEFWAELSTLRDRGISPFTRLDTELLSETLDLIMGVLARYEGAMIVNDSDLPVVALPKSNSHNPPDQ